jgi:hypothetical protein
MSTKSTDNVDEYEIRQYLPGDETGIVNLLKRVYSPHRSLDEWIWKHLETPLKKYIIVITKNGNRIIGCDHNNFFMMKIGDKILQCTYGSDLAVHPDFRKRGINTNMRKLLWALREEKKVQFHYSITQSPIMIEHLSKLKSRFPHKLRKLIWINDIGLHFRVNPRKYSWFFHLGFTFLRLIYLIKNVFLQKPHVKRFQISTIYNFDKKFDSFWAELKNNYNFIGERNRDYLRWRYLDPSVGEYTIRKVEENGVILGYCAISINRYQKEYLTGRIDDLLTLTDRLDVIQALVTDAISFFRKKNVNLCTYLGIKGHINEKVLIKNGFLNSELAGIAQHQIFYTAHGIEDELYKIKASPPSRIYLSQGDTF